ncbi:NAD(P)-dependent alcohol dehydrogenase [Dactylosporangium sp. NPDC050688]|uniref:NAD(P)-dependent alcohol dehydrogenase n=1 Tax=Dactylosporangium sp. NPDC050688 TaxID=3157217 RepID=UPI0034043404
MKAIVQDRYGPADVLRLGDVEPPVAAAGEVLVRVHAASVNARDWHVMRGDPYLARLAFGLGAPKVRVRGTDFAGVVEAVGAGVTRFRAGDEVFGESDAAFAEYVRVPETGALEVKPANLTFEQAAALPLAANTALMGLRDAAGLRTGQHVLINGASGGVGTFAVQLAKAFGARVTAVCSTRNLDLVRSLGADRVIDYTKEDFTRAGDVRYDVVFDLVGNRSLADCRRVLAPAGTLVLSGGGVFEGGSLFGPMGLLTRGRLVSRFVRHRVLVLTAVPSRENLATLRELAEAGALTPVIDRTFPFGEAAQAVRYLEVDHARAKVVITV